MHHLYPVFSAKNNCKTGCILSVRVIYCIGMKENESVSTEETTEKTQKKTPIFVTRVQKRTGFFAIRLLGKTENCRKKKNYAVHPVKNTRRIAFFGSGRKNKRLPARRKKVKAKAKNQPKREE